MTAPALIWAMTENRVIGRNNGLPWKLPDDMRWFLRHTKNKPVIMGRKTFESMPSALPGRRNLVLSQNPDFSAPEAEVFTTLEGSYRAVGGVNQPEPMVIGGSHVYRQALMEAGEFALGRLYRTLIHTEMEGDVFFPEVCMEDWRQVFCERREQDAQHEFAFTFEIFEPK